MRGRRQSVVARPASSGARGGDARHRHRPPLHHPSTTTLPPLPENTVAPSAAQAQHSTGWSWLVAALGTACPLGCTSQQRTWLSQEPAMSRLDVGEKARQETESVGGDGTSKSLLGLWGAPAAAAPKAVPNDMPARRVGDRARGAAGRRECVAMGRRRARHSLGRGLVRPAPAAIGGRHPAATAGMRASRAGVRRAPPARRAPPPARRQPPAPPAPRSTAPAASAAAPWPAATRARGRVQTRLAAPGRRPPRAACAPPRGPPRPPRPPPPPPARWPGARRPRRRRRGRGGGASAGRRRPHTSVRTRVRRRCRAPASRPSAPPAPGSRPRPGQTPARARRGARRGA